MMIYYIYKMNRMTFSSGKCTRKNAQDTRTLNNNILKSSDVETLLGVQINKNQTERNIPMSYVVKSNKS